MRSSKWFEEALGGAYGSGVRKAAEMVLALAEAFEAEGLVPVRSAHVSGVSYRTIGDYGLRFLEELSQEGVRVRVEATMNPAGMDMARWREMGVPEEFAQKQTRIVECLRRMGVKPALTCTPYLAGNRPERGSHVAWAESSAVVYANSVLGAWTNRECGPSALASAITGFTPKFGMHVEEERRPTHLVEVEGRVEGTLMYSALGYYVGREVGRGVPSIPKASGASQDELKALGAGLATSGGVAMFSTKPVGDVPRIRVSPSDLRQVVEELSTGSGGLVCLGCPHLSLRELEAVYELASKHGVRGEVWLFTSRSVYEEAVRLGVVQGLERSGVRVFRDTCMVVSPLEDMGVREVVTDSCKAAHYITLMTGGRVRVTLKPREECVRGDEGR